MIDIKNANIANIDISKNPFIQPYKDINLYNKEYNNLYLFNDMI